MDDAAAADRFTLMLDTVRKDIENAVQCSAFAHLFAGEKAPLIGGKMLRAKLIITVGMACETAPARLIAAASAVEMLHAASLLHDDVVDGGRLRRGAPALWITHGPKLAVLIGDMLLSLAFQKIADTQPASVPVLAQTLADMCQAEIQQELALQANTGTWEDCLQVAAGKTGSLFAFAAGCAAGDTPPLAQQLSAAGNQLGIAYQLADDLLDSKTEYAEAGKTLGTDAQSQKLTAARFAQAGTYDPARAIEEILAEASDLIKCWPVVQSAWQAYIETNLRPLLRAYTAAPSA